MPEASPLLKVQDTQPTLMIMIMNAISQALIILTVTTVAFSQTLPTGCTWYATGCPTGTVNFAECSCDCPGSLLCCNQAVQNNYSSTWWSGTAPFCEGHCSDCGSDGSCWQSSICGNGQPCDSGNKILCAHKKSEIIVSS